MENQPLPVQQARMMASAELAAEALAATADAVITVNTHGEITSWNPIAEVMLGHPADRAAGQSLALIIPAEYRARRVSACHAAMGSGKRAHAGCPARGKAMTGHRGQLTLAMSLGLLTGPDRPVARHPSPDRNEDHAMQATRQMEGPERA